MQNNVEPDFQSRLDAVFAQLNPEAVEEFYVAYHEWSQQQRMSELRQRIEMVRAQQAENEQRLRESQPSAIALAALVRLQANGVSDIALLDAMLERGESWLDQTMQRLDYFEQFDDFISDDYTKWCQGALEGAFDWIDSLREDTQQTPSAQNETSDVELLATSADAEDVEALLLQRLAIEREDDQSWQDATTVKRPAIKTPVPEIVTTESTESEEEGQEHLAPEDGVQQDTEIQTRPAEYISQDESTQSDETTVTSDTAGSSGPEEQIIPEEVSVLEASALSASEPEQPALLEFAPGEEIAPDEDELQVGDDQPAFIESPPVEEPPAAGDEPDASNEQPVFVEFATLLPPEVSMPEETSYEAVEQAEPSEVVVPEDIPAGEDANQSEASKQQEMENSAFEEALPHAPYEEVVMPSNLAGRPIRSTPRKTGVIRGLIRLIFGS